MSWKIINRLLGLASINASFRQQLQADPFAALEAQGIELSPEELDMFKLYSSLPFPEFCRHLSEKLAPNELHAPGEADL